MSGEPLSAMGQAVLELLATGPLSKAELARRISVRPAVLGGCLATLASRGQVVISGGRVALPGMLDEGEPRTDEERFHAQCAALWHQRGVLAINPTDVPDGYLRERLCLIGLQMYGRRGAR